MVDEAVKEGASRGMEIEVLERRSLSGARFSFSFETFSHDHGAALRARFEVPPPGVTIDDLQIEETIHPEAKGVEAYAPAHEYQLEGTGTVQGALRAVLALHQHARDEELIKESKLEVVDA